MIRIAFINLDRAGDRRLFMEAQAAGLGLVFERLPAVEAKTLSDAEASRIGRSWERPLSKAEIACFLSHQTLWQEVARSGQPMLIMEDDAVLSPRLPSLLAAIGEAADMDLLNLEDFGRRRYVVRHSAPLGAKLSRLRVYRDKAGAAAYILWPEGARKLLAKAAISNAAPADAFLHATTSLVAYLCEPALAIQAEVLGRRGLSGGFNPPTSVQAPRRRVSLTPANARFVFRRLATQLRLLRQQARRLFGVAIYREVPIDPADFPLPSDQTQS